MLICVDLSKPHNLYPSLLRWIKLVRNIITRRVSELAGNAATAATANAMKEAASARIGIPETCQDFKRLRPCEVPLYIVGTKYDVFKNTPSIQRRATMQLLRFVAHYHGATLLSCSTAGSESAVRDSFKVTYAWRDCQPNV